MKEYWLDSQEYARKRQVGFIIDTFIVLCLVGFFASDWSIGWPVWLKVLLVVGAVVFHLLGIMHFVTRREVICNSYFTFLESYLGYFIFGKLHKIPYNDLSIKKVKKIDGEMVAIWLCLGFGSPVKLEGYRCMDEMYESFKARIPEDRISQ